MTLGNAGGDVGAGQLYYTVPVRLVAPMSDGSVQTFAGCYTLHLARPQLQAVPPYHPLGIQYASIDLVQEGDVDSSSAAAC